MARALASTVASYLELMAPSLESIGVSSWSSTLLAAVNAMRPTVPGETKTIVQVLGGVGVPSAQRFATRLTERFAQVSKAEPIFMLAPGVVETKAAKRALLADASCRQAMERFDSLSALLLGIGAIPPSRMLRESGNVFTDQDLEDLKHAGAVGDVCMRFYDSTGRHVKTSFDERVAEQVKIFERDTPLGRMATVDEMVGPAVFLVSRAASFCTGVDLIVDGGFVCW